MRTTWTFHSAGSLVFGRGAAGQLGDIARRLPARRVFIVSDAVLAKAGVLDAVAGPLRDLCDTEGCCLVVTTGGTGPARRDVTPEATAAVCDKLLDGFGEQMRAVSLRSVPTAILSRQIAGTRGRSLIVNLPGKPAAIRDCLLAVFPAIPYCIDLIEGPYLTTHEGVVKAFRPKS